MGRYDFGKSPLPVLLTMQSYGLFTHESPRVRGITGSSKEFQFGSSIPSFKKWELVQIQSH
jgi:hypothetical protein